MPKPARRRTANVLTMPSVESPTAVPIASGVTEGDIAGAHSSFTAIEVTGTGTMLTTG